MTSGGLEDLVELGTDELATLEELSRDRVNGVFLLVDQPLRLLVETLEELVGEGEHLWRRAHRIRREREKRGAHAPRADVGDRAGRGIPEIGRRVRRLRLQ